MSVIEITFFYCFLNEHITVQFGIISNDLIEVTGFLKSLGRVELATSFFGWLLLIRFCIKYCFNFRLFSKLYNL
ncbi:hypothetical protein RCL_jg6791.t1 [Rhizophagus clarus]|uniref:Uncharacterized protein n=1 Tax=Rhizophagus clarus TaxID=94130 RepID=A0A8H3L9H2_9GLOM|nr:hypothetical protein RCL_jg6791.t1 [Rhizophagus clarus]